MFNECDIKFKILWYIPNVINKDVPLIPGTNEAKISIKPPIKKIRLS